MSNFRPIDRQTAYLLPPSVDDWLPVDHLARFVVDVVDQLDVSAMSKAYRGSGSASYHPRLLVGLLVYGYATGVFSSRKLERATYDSAAFRFVDRSTFCQDFAFGARNGPDEAGDGGAGRDEDPRQRQQAQRAVL